MKCPICATVDLNLAERQGVEIDYCPQCRGVWLDRGELDKIIERSYSAQPAPRQEQRPYDQHEHCEPRRHDSHGQGHQGYHKRKSWLSELFD